jgi:amino-acid N-acetyltransferase
MPVMELRAEPARPHDLEPALELIRRAGLPEKGVVEQFGHFLVVRDMGRLIGLAGLEVHGKEALLRSVVVDPNYRAEGVGGLLVNGVLELAARMDLSSVYLLTTHARDYFLRHGFKDCPRESAPEGIRGSWEFTTGCPSTSAFMTRAVPAATS